MALQTPPGVDDSALVEVLAKAQVALPDTPSGSTAQLWTGWPVVMLGKWNSRADQTLCAKVGAAMPPPASAIQIGDKRVLIQKSVTEAEKRQKAFEESKLRNWKEAVARRQNPAARTEAEAAPERNQNGRANSRTEPQSVSAVTALEARMDAQDKAIAEVRTDIKEVKKEMTNLGPSVQDALQRSLIEFQSNFTKQIAALMPQPSAQASTDLPDFPTTSSSAQGNKSWQEATPPEARSKKTGRTS